MQKIKAVSLHHAKERNHIISKAKKITIHSSQHN